MAHVWHNALAHNQQKTLKTSVTVHHRERARKKKMRGTERMKWAEVRERANSIYIHVFDGDAKCEMLLREAHLFHNFVCHSKREKECWTSKQQIRESKHQDNFVWLMRMYVYAIVVLTSILF